MVIALFFTCVSFSEAIFLLPVVDGCPKLLLIITVGTAPLPEEILDGGTADIFTITQATLPGGGNRSSLSAMAMAWGRSFA